MKRLYILMYSVFTILTISAQQFNYEYAGATLRYSILDEQTRTVEVASGNIVSGELTIPSVVVNNDVEYQVISIGKSAFNECDRLVSVDIPGTVTTIGMSAFYNCDMLESVTIPDSITIIGDEAFYWCASLKSITLPDSVIIIGDYAFSGCDNLESVNIPDSVTTIGEGAFSWCISLTSINIPASVISIGTTAFSCCRSLREIIVDKDNNHFKSESGVLYDFDMTTLFQCPCTKTEINIPSSVTMIGVEAFRYCDKLTSIVIPNSVTYIDDKAFFSSDLISIDIPDSVTYIGEGAFQWCDSLISVHIGSSVTSIGEHAFYECENLSSLYLGKEVSLIGESAFSRCDNLSEIFVATVTPPTADDSVFEGYNIETYNKATLYVPQGATNSYKNSTDNCWALFSNIVEYNPNTGLDSVFNSGNNTEDCEIFNLNGVKVADGVDTLSAGVYIIREGNKVSKVIVK